MKVLALILFATLSISTFASMRVMTFNTTCSHFCEKGNYDKYSKRKHWIVDTVKRNNPDLIGFQEVFTSRQLNWFKKKLKDYYLIYHRKFFIFRYADPALFIKKSKFRIVRSGGFWLGPLGYWFSFGWKFGLPRRVQWARIQDRATGQIYYFSSSHFDNRKKNKEKSARVFTKAFRKVTQPIIFAADTNLRPWMDGFKHLQTKFHDSFDLKENFELVRNSDTNIHDSCNLEKDTVFPECRVDHIMLSKAHEWRVHNWGVDQFKYGSKNRFTSDHRAYFADIELLE